MDILFLISGLILGGIIGWLFLKFRLQSNDNSKEWENKLITLDKEKSVLDARLAHSMGDNEKLSEELKTDREKLNVANNRLAKAEEAFRNMQEKLASQKTEMEELQKRFSAEFENIANRLLEEKSKKFTEQNKTNLDVILNPLKEKIKEFEEKVDKTYKAESAERITLKTEIKSLIEMNKQISEEANNLAKALKGDNKKQGNWGEVILGKILESSGLTEGQEYKTQISTSNDDGRRIQPDVVIYLPNNKHIIVDSKVSLVAYEAFVNSEADEEKERFKKEHLKSVKTHIAALSDKSYQTSSDFNTPDFVLLFIPIESSFSVAIQADVDIFNYAWERKVVIVSPSTLLATLKTIDSIWKQEKQTKNALEIAEQSGRLYDKFVGFVEDMKLMGDRISATQKTYEESMKKLSEGSGNLINRVENIRKLGAKNTKVIPQKFLNADEEEVL